jgi:hypothetical protein
MMIYKPERKYVDENGEIKIPDDAIAVQRQIEEVTMKEQGVESKGIRVYYSYLVPISEEPKEEVIEEEPREEGRRPIIARKKV